MHRFEFFKQILRVDATLTHYLRDMRKYPVGSRARDFLCGDFARSFQNILDSRERDWIEMSGRKNKGFVANIKFCDVELTSEGKAAFRKWVWGDQDTLEYINGRGLEGYKAGTRYDAGNGCWIASLTCANEKDPNYGWCLSARGQSFLHAFAVVAYKDTVLLEGVWNAKPDMDDNDSGWG